jgi:hypothetical protein
MALNATNQYFIQLMPLITIQLLIKKTFSCTNDIVAKDDNNNRLVRLVTRLGLVVRVCFKVLKVIVIKFTSKKELFRSMS